MIVDYIYRFFDILKLFIALLFKTFWSLVFLTKIHLLLIVFFLILFWCFFQIRKLFLKIKIKRKKKQVTLVYAPWMTLKK